MNVEAPTLIRPSVPAGHGLGAALRQIVQLDCRPLPHAWVQLLARLDGR